MNRPSDLIKEIHRRLSQYRSEIIDGNKIGTSDLNKDAERFYAPILNEIFDTNFEVLEDEIPNNPGIDLGCKDTKIAFQITSQSENHFEKVKKSIYRFISNYHIYSIKYEQIYFLFTGEPYSSKKTDKDIQSFIDETLEKYHGQDIQISVSNSNIYSVHSLIKEIRKRHFEYPDKLKKILEILEKLCPTNMDFEEFKSRKLLEGLKSISDEAKKQPNILLAIKYIHERFDNLVVYPRYMLTKMYPFTIQKHPKTYYRAIELITDNDEMVDFFSKIIKGDYSDIISEDYTKENIDNDIKNVLSTIFNLNDIDYISGMSGEDKRVSVYKLFKSEECTCERCLYRKLNFTPAILDIKNKELNDEEGLTEAYMQHQLGNFINSYKKYDELSKQFTEDKKFVKRFICEYNKFKLRNYVEYYGKYKAKIEKVDLDDLLISIRLDGKEAIEIVEVLRWIKEEKFLNERIYRIVNLIDEIEYHHAAGHYKRSFISNKVIELLVVANQVINFTRFNYIVHDDTPEFSILVMKVIQGFMVLSKMRHSIEEELRIEEKWHIFIDYAIDMVLFYGEADKLRNIAHLHNIELIPYKVSSNDKISAFVEKVMNFCKSYDIVERLVHEQKRNINYFLSNKINRIYGNIIFLLLILDLEETELNLCIKSILEISTKKSSVIHFGDTLKGFDYLVRQKAKEISIENYEEILVQFLSQGTHLYGFLKIFTQSILIKSPEYRLPEGVFNSLPDDYNSEELPYKYHTEIVDLWTILPNYQRKKYTTALENGLNWNFQPESFYQMAILEVVDYKLFINKYVESVRPWILSKQFMIWFNHVIDIWYKFNLDVNLLKSLNPDGDRYFDWLLNLETFDYSEFNPEWITKYPSVYYFEEFKKIPQIRKAVIDYLQKNENKKLSEIYFKYFTDNDEILQIAQPSNQNPKQNLNTVHKLINKIRSFFGNV